MQYFYWWSWLVYSLNMWPVEVHASQLAVYLAAFIITKLVPQYRSHIIALVPHGHYNHVTLMYCLHFPKYILYMGTKQLKYTTFWLVEYFTHCKIKHKRLFSTDQSQQNIILSQGLQVIEWCPLSWNSFWNETICKNKFCQFVNHMHVHIYKQVIVILINTHLQHSSTFRACSSEGDIDAMKCTNL